MASLHVAGGGSIKTTVGMYALLVDNRLFWKFLGPSTIISLSGNNHGNLYIIIIQSRQKGDPESGSLARWRLRGGHDVRASSSSYRNKSGTWNVRTLNEPGTLSCVIKEMENLELDILGISETHWIGAGDFRTQTLKTRNTY
ncbi:craniofacial development protein 2 [Elysia marginata]|uniref:Craniofacial development protein 2 n=1 Tax=Elysia marginata TaxID=1093978 RepID=A0AAV4H5W2_9GAST|nr:craniofacial development protein 2 [Elysia marginata]